ncbi:hypothetical protein ADL15_39655 [Actinoplanes awajinensis subsp. mycoplanecinus]|uniref:Uncharacterized protein n=2 Tax=Actinoplanes awajinensis TaxID=135946 RepID=A0A117MMU6_9ACTN|nr:hypothetical protein ADL15_39655 [Actinoplanes awajinensis subsp. mycoplanecinus]
MPDAPRDEQDVLVNLLRSEGDRLRAVDPPLLTPAGGWRTRTGGMPCWRSVYPYDGAEDPSMEITIALEGEAGRYHAESDIGTFDGHVMALLQTGPQLRDLEELLAMLRQFFTDNTDLSVSLARQR